MPHRSENKEFVEALSRGLEIIRAFHPHKPLRTVSDLSAELMGEQGDGRREMLPATVGFRTGQEQDVATSLVAADRQLR